MHVTAQNQFN